MKLLLIMAAVFGLVVCQVQALRGNFYQSPDMGYRSPQQTSDSRNYLRAGIVDKVIAMIKEFIQRIIGLINLLKDPLAQIGFPNVSKLLGNIMSALSQFVKDVGEARTESWGFARDTQEIPPCLPYQIGSYCLEDNIDH